MKFWGLILICASSSLALLLPAIGVVKFPMQPHPGVGAESTTGPSMTSTTNGMPNGQMPNALGIQPLGDAADPRNAGTWAGNGIAALPPPAGPANRESRTVPVSAPLPPGAAVPNGNPLGMASDPPSLALGTLPFTQVPTQTVGLGVWLLLGPLMLVGLAMWTLAPAPRATSKPSKD
jgi:hypothetical protein